MRNCLFIALLVVECGSAKKVRFDPFRYNPARYEKVSINYNVSGAGDTTLFFIHGWNLDLGYWKQQEAVFSANYKTVLIDLAGCGKSGKNRKAWTIENFARDVSSVIKKERLQNVILVAHSMGGEIALDAALANPKPVIGIIGIDNFKNVGMTISAEDSAGMQPYIAEFLQHYPAAAEAMARELIVSKDSAVVHRVVKSYKTAPPEIAVPSLLFLYPKAAAAKNKLPLLPFPMKFIMSTNTSYDEAALRRYCTAGVHIETLDSCGHFPMVERPAQLNKALERLIKTTAGK